MSMETKLQESKEQVQLYKCALELVEYCRSQISYIPDEYLSDDETEPSEYVREKRVEAKCWNKIIHYLEKL